MTKAERSAWWRGLREGDVVRIAIDTEFGPAMFVQAQVRYLLGLRRVTVRVYCVGKDHELPLWQREVAPL